MREEGVSAPCCDGRAVSGFRNACRASYAPPVTEQFLVRRDPLAQATFEDPLAVRGEMHVTLYTDSYVVRAVLRTRQRRLTDALTVPGEPFLVVEEAVFEEFGSRALVERAPFAQINLSTVLFAFAAEEVAATPELRTVKVPQQALISLPPFRIVGHIHLLPDRSLSQALGELQGRFVPVTDAAFWSDRLNEARTPVQMLAFNHARAQILAPYEERDVWAGPATTPEAAAGEAGASDPVPATGGAASPGSAAGNDPWLSAPDRAPNASDSGSDPWRDAPGTPGAPSGSDPWRDVPNASEPGSDPWREGA